LDECVVYEEEVTLPDGSRVKAKVVVLELGKPLSPECSEKLGRRGG